ncbi:esterase/lipase family protein [Corynebacterium gerontici]|uniref:Lipase (Class 2) n=1 Tax=Corynebacterium gerontici TaxID=2079234 RepID=A0A3G6J6S5_9CORY|nr:alpha/beta fold hydrolase [Corynebacterium gerontici]AZA11714.1 Lipase (class 2) [Corynebacterium gerontici]
MDQQLEAVRTPPGAIAATKQHPSPQGANGSCVPKPNENPVVLIHRMTSNLYSTFGAIAPLLEQQGKRVFAMNYGYYGEELHGSSATQLVPGFYGYASLNDSLAQVSRQIDLVKQHTGAQKVDSVSWSVGSSLATAYVKQVCAEGVGTVVSLDGVLRGTTML